MVTAPVRATQQGTATRSSQPGAHTGSPALATARWMSSTPPLLSGRSICQSVTLGQSVPVHWSDCPRVCLSLHPPVHICSLVVMGLSYMAYPKGVNCLPVHLPVCLSYFCLYSCVCLCLHAVLQPSACLLSEPQSKHANDNS